MSGESFFERLHAIDRRLTVLEHSQVTDLRNIEDARKLQAKEYERRLEILNGEAGRLSEMQRNYVPREVYDQKHDELIREINALKAYRDTAIGRQTIIATIIPILISLLFLWLGKR